MTASHVLLGRAGEFEGSTYGIPASILEAISKAGKYKNNREHRVRRVITRNDIGDDFAAGSKDGNSPLPKVHVDSVVKKGRGCIPKERSKEN